MKKFSYLLLGAAGLVLASCSNEDVVDPTLSGDGMVSFEVSLPQNVSTRAFGDGTSANNLKYQLYKLSSDGTFTCITEEGYSGKITDFYKSKTFNFQLIKGDSYRFVAVASGVMGANSSSAYFPEFKDNQARLLSNGMGRGSVPGEQGDLFYTYYDFTVGTTAVGNVELKRGVAQINLGTNDVELAKNLGISNIKNVAITVKKQPTIINLITGAVSSTTYDIKHSCDILGTENVYPIEDYEYMGIAYSIVDDEPTNYDIVITYNYTLNGQTKSESRTIGSVPLQRNRRTNIYGSLLTSNTELTVLIDDSFDTPDLEADPFYNALANGGNIVLSEDMTVSRQYPITKNTTIDLDGHTINSEFVATPSTVSTFWIEEGGNLTINGETPGSGITAESGKTQRFFSIWKGGTLTINGGTYEAAENGEMIYIGDGGGTVNITGGVFKNGCSPDASQNFLLNCLDSEYAAKTAKFVITGGTFYNFNPAHSTVDLNPNANWVPEGYRVVETTDGINKIYTVIATDSVDEVVNSAEGLKEALTSGENKVIMFVPGTYQNVLDAIYGANDDFLYLTQENTLLGYDVTINGYKTLQFNAFSNLNSGNTKGATIKGFTFEGYKAPTGSSKLNGEFYDCSFIGGIYSDSANAECNFYGCQFICEDTNKYAYHNGDIQKDQLIKDSYIQGKVDLGLSGGTVTFENCNLSIKTDWGIYGNNGQIIFKNCTIIDGSKDMVKNKNNGTATISWQD